MVLFVHGKGLSEKDDFVVLTESLQADINRYLAERKGFSPTDPLFVRPLSRGGRLTV